jgi:hypothetical protein
MGDDMRRGRHGRQWAFVATVKPYNYCSDKSLSLISLILLAI